MIKIKLCIMLNNHQQFIQGNPVSGNVVIHVNKEAETRGINITFLGSILCELREKITSTAPGRSAVIKTDRKAVKQLFADRINLLNNGRSTVKLQPGYHSYPFEFLLPQGIPSSFTGTKGKVEYTLTATMKREFRFNKTHKLNVNVLDSLDLNNFPSARNPVIFEMQKSLRCSRPVKLFCRLPKTGFVPGEEITVTFHIDNQSYTTFKKCKIYLIQAVSYHAKENQRTAVDGMLLGQAEHIGEEEWTVSVNIKIPAVCATDLSAKIPQIILVKYYLQVQMKFPFGITDIIRSFPVLIGNVPITTTTAAIPAIMNPISTRTDTISPMLNPTAPAITDSVINQNVEEDSTEWEAPTIRYFSNSPERTDESRQPETNPYLYQPSCPILHRSPSPSQMSDDSDISQELNNEISTEICIPPSYATVEDLPPSYAQAILLEFDEK